jgi:hypothetical protein
MKHEFVAQMATAARSIAALAFAAQDRYTVEIPDGLSFSEFRGYDTRKPSPCVRRTRESRPALRIP